MAEEASSISTIASSSNSTPAMSTNCSAPEVTIDEDELLLCAEDHVMSSSSMVTDSDSSVPENVQEPNFDAYVAALQLQDCDDCQPNMGDSNY